MPKNDTFRNIFGRHKFKDSLQIAIKGIAYLFLYHRNMRIIFLMGIAAFLTGVYLHLEGIELAALSITITLVFMAEIFNTAVELMMDILRQEYHTKIRIIKDIAAGIVVLTCLNSLAVGYILFNKRLVR